MKRKIRFLFLLIGLVGLGIAGLKIFENRSPKQGSLKVNSSQTASIFLSNKHLGRTPYEGNIDPGDYVIKLVPESTVQNFTSWQGNIHLASNRLTYVNADLTDSDFTTAVDILWLEKIAGKGTEFSITTNPDGATVSIDGDTKGITPLSLSSITSGDHKVTVSSFSFSPRSLKVRATPGYKLIAAIKLATTNLGLQPNPEATASSQISPTPAGSASKEPAKPYVTIKNTPTGFLRVRLEPSITATEAARVKPGEKYSVISTQDGWHEIKYDGDKTGWISGQYAEKVE